MCLPYRTRTPTRESLGCGVRRQTQAHVEASNPAPQRRPFSWEDATVSAGSSNSELRRLLKEMNILSAHRSSSPTTPATQCGLLRPHCRVCENHWLDDLSLFHLDGVY